MSLNRSQIINDVLDELDALKNNHFLNEYALQENVLFFKATQSIWKYIKWFLFKTPKINSEKLLEFTDFSSQKWEIEMHKNLAKAERDKFPGLIKPLVENIVKIILKSNDLKIIADLGCGAMEVERQIIQKLISLENKTPSIFIGIDKSNIVAQIAKENFKEIQDFIEFYEIDNLDMDILNNLINQRKKNYLVIICKNDIFKLDNFFPSKIFDLIFHVFFKHHLNSSEKQNLDDTIIKLSKQILEYDGYKSRVNMIAQSITAWSSPVFLNAAIFSSLRFSKKKFLSKKYNNLKFYWHGNYLRFIS